MMTERKKKCCICGKDAPVEVGTENSDGSKETKSYCLEHGRQKFQKEWKEIHGFSYKELVTKLQKLDYKFKKIPRLVIPDYHADCRQWFNQIERTLRDFEKDWKKILVSLED